MAKQKKEQIEFSLGNDSEKEYYIFENKNIENGIVSIVAEGDTHRYEIINSKVKFFISPENKKIAEAFKRERWTDLTVYEKPFLGKPRKENSWIFKVPHGDGKVFIYLQGNETSIEVKNGKHETFDTVARDEFIKMKWELLETTFI